MWEEGLTAAVGALADTPFAGINGTYVTMPPRNELGIGALCFAFAEPELAEAWVDEYYAVLAEDCVPIGRTVNANLAVSTMMTCAPTTREAIDRGMEGAMVFQANALHYYRTGNHQPGVTSLWDQFQAQKAAMGEGPMTDEEIARAMGGIGSPDDVADWLRRYEAAGVDEVLFITQHGRTTHEHILESIRLVGTEVLPEFRERERARQAERERRLAPVIAAAMARKPPVPVAPADYRHGAVPLAWADGRPVSGMADAIDAMNASYAGVKEPRPEETGDDPEASHSRRVEADGTEPVR
jgi:hypothetical protein